MHMATIGRRTFSILILLAMLRDPAHAAWTYPGCADATDSQFRRVRIVQRSGPVDPTLDEPMKLAFDAIPNPEGGVYSDIYFVERKGKVKYYDARKKTVKVLAQIDTYYGQDH